MLTVNLRPEVENRLNKLVEQTHKDKSFYVELAIEELLDEYEDAIKVLSIQERINKGEEKLYSLEEVKRMYNERNKQALDH